MLARGSLVVLGALIVAWFVLGAREAREIARATPAVLMGPSAPRGALPRAERELESAAWLNPDRQVQVLEGRIAISEGRTARARRLLEGVVRAEPENLEGWLWLVGASLTGSREGAVALAHLRLLDPIDARSP